MVLSGLGADPQPGCWTLREGSPEALSAGPGAIAPRRSDCQHGPCACISEERGVVCTTTRDGKML